MASFQNMSELLPRTLFFYWISLYFCGALLQVPKKRETFMARFFRKFLEVIHLVLIIISPDVTQMNRQHTLLTIQEKSHSTNT